MPVLTLEERLQKVRADIQEVGKMASHEFKMGNKPTAHHYKSRQKQLQKIEKSLLEQLQAKQIGTQVDQRA